MKTDLTLKRIFNTESTEDTENGNSVLPFSVNSVASVFQKSRPDSEVSSVFIRAIRGKNQAVWSAFA